MNASPQSDKKTISELREALAPFAVIGGLLNMVSEAAIPDGASARFLKLDGLLAEHFRAAHRAFAKAEP